jgi:uncharacterized NAD-dependent epimerase/dehydratase family protein
MTSKEREDLEVDLRGVWEQCAAAREAGQRGMELISSLKAKLVSAELTRLKAEAKQKGVEL